MKKERGKKTGKKIRMEKYGKNYYAEKKYGKKLRIKKSTGKKVQKKSTGNNNGGGGYGGKSTGGNVRGKIIREKKYGGNRKARQGLFRSRDFVTSCEKGPTRADIAQLPVAHAQNILPDRARDWRHFRLSMRNGPILRTILLKCDFVRAHILLTSNAIYRYISRRGAFQIYSYIIFLNISDLNFRTNK